MPFWYPAPPPPSLKNHGYASVENAYKYFYHKGTSIRQAPVFRHLRALRKSPWKFIILTNEL